MRTKHVMWPATLVTVAVAGALALGVSAAGAQGVPGVSPNKCLTGKTKCVDKKVAGLLKCREKCQKEPLNCGATQTQCENKVIAKFDGAGDPLKSCFGKLEAKQNVLVPETICTTTEDLVALEAKADTMVAGIVGTLEGSPPPACGDGIVNGAESCDGANLAGETCATLGYATGTLACTAGCGYDVSGCVATTCGNGTIEAPESCDGSNLGGATCVSLGFASGSLACTSGCGYDVTGCVGNPPNMCGNGTIEAPESCDGANLGGATCASLGYALGGTLGCTAGCGYDTSGCVSQAFPATGQTTCWNAAGGVIACAGTGQDGEIQAGAMLSYTDNGDGTITDLNTRLMWEKKSNDGGLHDKDTLFRWNPGPGSIWEWISQVNTEGGSGFAGHTDWRIPNIKELQSILNYGSVYPYVFLPGLITACPPSCTVLTCSCNVDANYWSSTTSPGSGSAWRVGVDAYHFVLADDKNLALNYVRAVRGGL